MLAVGCEAEPDVVDEISSKQVTIRSLARTEDKCFIYDSRVGHELPFSWQGSSLALEVAGHGDSSQPDWARWCPFASHRRLADIAWKMCHRSLSRHQAWLCLPMLAYFLRPKRRLSFVASPVQGT